MLRAPGFEKLNSKVGGSSVWAHTDPVAMRTARQHITEKNFSIIVITHLIVARATAGATFTSVDVSHKGAPITTSESSEERLGSIRDEAAAF
jgi:hypothetical protein